MNKYTAITMMTLAFANAGAAADWSYEGDNGPEHWGELAPEFVQCRVGLNQSPIDIVATVDADLPALEIDYRGSTLELVNNGHTAQANVAPGNFMRVGGESFELLQLHLHTPSEHRINGKLFPMETHYVHRNDRGELAVVAVLHIVGVGCVRDCISRCVVAAHLICICRYVII